MWVHGPTSGHTGPGLAGSVPVCARKSVFVTSHWTRAEGGRGERQRQSSYDPHRPHPPSPGPPSTRGFRAASSPSTCMKVLCAMSLVHPHV